MTYSNGSVVVGSDELSGFVEFLAEFEAFALSAAPAFPVTEDSAGVAIVVLVLFDEVEAVADSVLLPGISLVEDALVGTPNSRVGSD